MFLAIALCLPLVAATAMIGASMAQDQSMLNLWLLGLLATSFLVVVVWASLLPPVRQVEVSTARALLEYDERSAARRTFAARLGFTTTRRRLAGAARWGRARRCGSDPVPGAVRDRPALLPPLR